MSFQFLRDLARTWQRDAKFLCFCGAAAVIIWFFGRGLDWTAVAAGLKRADIRLIALAIGAVCFTYVIRAWRWQVLLAPLTLAGWWQLFAATTVGFGAIFLLGRAGEVVRPIYLPLSEKHVTPGASFVTIGLERVYDTIAVILLFSANLVWFEPAALPKSDLGRMRGIGIILLVAALAGVLFLLWFRRHAGFLIDFLSRIQQHAAPFAAKATRAFLRLLEDLREALSVMVDPRALAATLGLTILLWMFITAAEVLVFRAFHLTFGLAEAIFVMGCGLVGSLVPTPGGAAGPFHAATAAGLIFLGVARDDAAAVSIVAHLVMFGPALLLGFCFFVRSDVRISNLMTSSNSSPVLEDRNISGPAPEMVEINDLSRNKLPGGDGAGCQDFRYQGSTASATGGREI